MDFGKPNDDALASVKFGSETMSGGNPLESDQRKLLKQRLGEEQSERLKTLFAKN